MFYGEQIVLSDKLIDLPKSTWIDGNIVSLTRPNEPVFIAHMDTVGENTMSKPLKIKGTTLYRPGYVLGADDRAGCWLIYQNIGHINFILTRDEEVGGLGISSLLSSKIFLDMLDVVEPSCGVVLDRRDTADIIGTRNGYCDDELVQELKHVLPTYSLATGSFSDADDLSRVLPCVNLSVGYYDAHTERETLDLEHLFWMKNKLIAIRDHLKGKVFNLGSYTAYGAWPRKTYNDYDFGYDLTCEMCGTYMDVTSTTIGNMCPDCMRDLIDEFSQYIAITRY